MFGSTVELIEQELECNKIMPKWVKETDVMYGLDAVEVLTENHDPVWPANQVITADEVCSRFHITLAELEASEIKAIWQPQERLSGRAVYSHEQYQLLVEEYGMRNTLFTINQIRDEYKVSQDTVRGVIRKTGILPKGKTGKENLYGIELIAEMDKRFLGNEITEEMLSMEQVIKGTHWTRAELKKRRVLHEVMPIYRSGRAYFSRSMINKMMNENRRLVSIREMSDGVWYTELALRLYVSREPIFCVIFNGVSYYRRKDLVRVLKSGAYRSVLEGIMARTSKDELRSIRKMKASDYVMLEDAVEAAFKFIGDHNKPDTYRLMKGFILKDCARISRLKNPWNSLKQSLRFCVKLLSEDVIKGEVSELTEFELTSLLNMKSLEYIRFCVRFFNYISTQGEYQTNSYDIEIKTQVGSRQVIPYSDKEWFELQEYLIDVNRHFVRASKDAEYCRQWLFMLIHCYCNLRASDVAEFPLASEYVVQTRDDITRALIARVSDEIERKLSNKHTQKTFARIFPARPPEYLKEAVVTALLLCGIHARSRNEARLFPRGYHRNYTKTIDSFFCNSKLDGFSFRSSRANHSFMRKLHRTGLKNGVSVYSAYGLASAMRSHLHEPGKASEATIYYIAATQGEKDMNEVVLSLLGRGIFGYVFEEMLYILTGSMREMLTPNEITTGINTIRNTFSPIEMESVTSHLLEVRSEREVVIDNLRSIPYEELKQMAEDIATDKRVCTIPGTYCMNQDPCPYATALGGVGCKYALMTPDAAHKLNTMTIKHIEQLATAPNGAIKEKEKRQVAILLECCADFIKAFKACGEDYIDYFIDIPQIQKRLKEIARKELDF